MTSLTEPAVLDVLCPMHLTLSASGHITHAGPTVAKLFRFRNIVGERFLEVFAVKRPRSVTSIADLRRASQVKLHLETRNSHRTELKGEMVPIPDADGAIIINLSFGISIIESVRDYRLTNCDFAATDLAIEMLYLVEAKSAAMEASRKLNQRLQGAKVAAEEQAFTDTLTGLKNRRALDHVLGRLVRSGTSFAVMHIDLDFFKAVNDTLGHAAGDHVLQVVAEAMVEETRNTDTVARVGGDEFTVVLPEVESDEILRRVGARIIERLEVPIPFDGEECRISASIGTVRVREGHETTMQTVLQEADIALYASKRAGRGCHTFFSPEMRLSVQADLPLDARANGD